MTITYPKGFTAAGIAAGIKASGKPDLALVVNAGPLDVAAGVFTSNRVKAAPVLWSQQAIKDGRLKAVILNSGGANACTGPEGFGDTHHTAEKVGEVLSIGAGEVAVCSTGLIGERLPMDKLLPGIADVIAQLSHDGGPAAAEAICTTDTVSKQEVFTNPDGWSIGGMAKGAGMLAPGLATMLVVLTTDAVLDAATADAALRRVTSQTFDRLDSDGCMSTNDTVLLLASGASGITPDPDDFWGGLYQVCRNLSDKLLADAEGATKEITIGVDGAATEQDAVEVGRAIARNNLLKCALFGNDPNWGRVLAAIGTTSAVFEPDQLDVSMNGVQICRGGAPGEDRGLVDLSGRLVNIHVNLNAGHAGAVIWTNDLSHAYVEENSAYSS
ncbi:MAG TPA: bifunctional glutamate N-acetyltransferase/amino-acid acetyltransferase ArgJ [Jatrophihabitans sp.]